MDEGYIMKLRRKICHDIRREMYNRNIRMWTGTMNDAIDYVCMVNDLEFDGKYEYQGEDWVRDTVWNYPEMFIKNAY